jgi:YVTN family beta-propeller protein
MSARIRLFLPMLMTVLLAAVISQARPAAAMAAARSGTSSAVTSGTIGPLPRVLVGSGPQAVVLDSVTHTAYVANENDNDLSVINTRSCNARDTAGCAQVPVTVAAGKGPTALAVDQATGTIYVADVASDTVSVVNGATCNASRTSGCGQRPRSVRVPAGPNAVAVDHATGTVYVTSGGINFSGTGDRLAVINGTTCNSKITSGCGQAAATVKVGSFPFGVAVDPATGTAYVTSANDNTVSVVNTATCNAGDTSGCSQQPPTVKVGSFPLPVAVNRVTNTVYVGNMNDSTLSVIDGATCNGKTTTGCGQKPPTVTVAGGPDGLGVNEATDTVFASNNSPGSTASAASVSVINGATCNATVKTGCGQKPPIALTGANPGFPAVDPATDTVYVPALGDNAVAIINSATCNATVKTGCGQTTPSTPAGVNPFSIVTDQATHTAYVGDSGTNEGFPFTISVINTNTCNGTHAAGCGQVPAATVPRADNPYGLALNQATGTLYATNMSTPSGKSGNTVSMIGTTTCNASDTTGCHKTPPTVTVGREPTRAAVDQATDTIYIANSGATTVSVIDGAHCNATVTSGCGHTPPVVRLKKPAWAVAVDQATDTIYAVSPGTPGTVSVIDGATCNASVTTGCSQTPPTVTVGNGSPVAGLAIDQSTDTIYAVNTIDNTVSVIDGAGCNAKVTSGCGHKPAHVNVGRQFFGFAAVDQATDTIYISDYRDDTVSVINGATCNGQNTTGCGHTPPAVTAGANPAGLAFDDTGHTLFAADNGAGALSVFSFQPPGRPTSVMSSLSDSQAHLTWQRPADGGLPITYQITPTPPCPGCHGLATPPTSGQPLTTVTGLTPGVAYTFTVTATNAAGRTAGLGQPLVSWRPAGMRGKT